MARAREQCFLKLKSLTLQGFKSFAQRTVLELSTGVAAVVGPNGSGKSNISDGIRWVLGEQSIRLLRGTRLEDVIFAGSDTKRPVGMAEVSLTFDNSAGKMPIEYGEVTVTRRVYRSGESEFLINRNACRLRDIQELFMDTGLGRGSLSIIGQGEVDAILSARPDERRAFLEEAAGITRYRSRKSEALQKLSQTEENLVRLGDIIVEVERQLGPLGEQAEAAKEHQRIARELSELEGLILWERKTRLEAACAQAKARVQGFTEERKSHRRSLNELETESEARSNALEALDRRLEGVRREGEEARKAQIEARHREEMAKERHAAALREEAERRERAKRAKTRRSEIAEERKKAQDAFGVVIQERREAEEDLDEVRRKVGEAKGGLENQDRRLAERRKEWQRLAEEGAALKARRDSGAQRLEALGARLREHLAQRGTHDEELRQAKLDLQRAQESLQKITDEALAVQKAHYEGEQRLEQLDKEHGELQKMLDEQRRRLQDMQAKRKALADMEDAREGYQRGVRAVLRAATSHGWALHGAVAEIFEAPSELETAIEVALGASQQFVVAQGDGDAKAAIEYLKARSLGRATFLPLESLRPQRVTDEAARRLQEIDGAIGVASELVRVPPQMQRAADYLLGRVAVARDLDAALRVSRGVRGFARVVTLEGDVIVPGGAMTGGSRQTRSEGLIGRSRRIAQLSAEIKRAEEEMARLADERDTLAERVQGTRTHVHSADVRRRELELSKHTVTRDVKEIQDRLQRAGRALDAWQAGSDRLKEEEARLTAELGSTNERLGEVEAEQAALGEAIAGQEEALTQQRQAEESLRDEVGRLSVALAGLRQREEQWRREIDRLTNEAKELDEAQTGEVDRLKEIETEKSNALVLQEESAKAGVAARAAVEASLQQETALVEQREELKRAAARLGVEIKETQERLNKIQEALTRAEVELGRHEAQVNGVLSELHERGIDAAPVPDMESINLPALERKSRSLKAQMDAIGPVNPNSVKEYEAVTERHAFLATQKRDLEEAKEQLREVIARIDRESRTKFEELFEAVQEQFKRVFTRLFGGGSARLELVDPDQPLESGIDIYVQPPGKKTQNLVALSGGERSLAAIALLFAILAVRPSPFCVLDEIDAALDEANLERFRLLLQEFSASTQFLIITHRQGTMESADSLFGVTMEESGVSRLVSLNIEDIKSA